MCHTPHGLPGLCGPGPSSDRVTRCVLGLTVFVTLWVLWSVCVLIDFCLVRLLALTHSLEWQQGRTGVNSCLRGHCPRAGSNWGQAQLWSCTCLIGEGVRALWLAPAPAIWLILNRTCCSCLPRPFRLCSSAWSPPCPPPSGPQFVSTPALWALCCSPRTMTRSFLCLCPFCFSSLPWRTS